MPPELWALVMDSLDYDELILASQTCQQWRAVAFDHPTFWRDVQIFPRGPLPSTLYWFALRLDAGKHRPLTLAVTIDDVDACKPLPDEFYALLRTSVSSVEKLRVGITTVNFARLWQALNAPAALLRAFTVVGLTSELDTPCIPPFIFEGHAPELRSVRLVGIEMPATELAVPAFARIEKVRLEVYPSMFGVFDVAWISHFPSAKSLAAYYPQGHSSPTALNDSVRQRILALYSLELGIDHRGFALELCQHLSLSCIPRLTLLKPIHEEVRMALNHLEGSLYEIAILPHVPVDLSDTFTISVVSTASRALPHRRCRTFKEKVKNYVNTRYRGASWLPHINLLFHDMSLWTRVRSLTLATSLWHAITVWQPVFSFFTELCIVIDMRSGERLAGLECSCGTLELLSLRSLGDDPRTLNASEVLSFAEQSLSSPCSTLRVHSPVVLRGETRALAQYFRRLEVYEGRGSSWKTFEEASTGILVRHEDLA
ncbi:hypothetical protein EXIGLDRAFT_729296 [Exidia glandulosa HHB12029]|uniref:F-box domain-containing protein n=1 Tax=Exidia glandulosa HHB12029 TaxID=1314781 RepID=A0A165CNB1_EXIGL|nr:hypothetical protein EXIGLDRAFT_729296 [Exidia glandulosa HHB12029]